MSVCVCVFFFYWIWCRFRCCLVELAWVSVLFNEFGIHVDVCGGCIIHLVDF